MDHLNHLVSDQLPSSTPSGKRLEALPLFSGLPSQCIQHILRHATEWNDSRGKLLYLKDDPETFLAIVLEGRVFHTLHNLDGREVIIDCSYPGELVGEAAWFNSERRCCNAQLEEGTRVLLLQNSDFPPLRHYPLFDERVRKLVCERLHRSTRFAESVCLHRLESRLARYFLSLAHHHGAIESSCFTVPHQVNQSTLAAMLNASRPKLNAQLQQWRRNGLIQQQHSTLRITDMHRLRELAQSS